VALGTLAWRQFDPLKPEMRLTESKARTYRVPSTTVPTQHIAETLFSLDLPSDWKRIPPPQTVYAIYSWQGTSQAGTSRRLDVYLNAIPPTLAVNHLLPVRAQGDAIDVTGPVSDNCINFTDKSGQGAEGGAVLAKWNGVNFLCDTGNYLRDVVAIGSTEGINTITLTGAQNGTHNVLLLYTDNNSTPDYTIFVGAVKSFHLL
jgi:hypothetical protein